MCVALATRSRAVRTTRCSAVRSACAVRNGVPLVRQGGLRGGGARPWLLGAAAADMALLCRKS